MPLSGSKKSRNNAAGELINILIEQEKYADAVDDILIKFIGTNKKKLEIVCTKELCNN